MTPNDPRPAQIPPAAGDISAKGSDVESAILHAVAQRESCTLDELLLTLSNFTFNQVLISVDRLSREGRVTLRATDPIYLSHLAPIVRDPEPTSYGRLE